MIIVNRINDVISVSYKDVSYNTLFSKEKFDSLLKISEMSQSVKTKDELLKLTEEVNALCKDDFKTKIESFHPEIYVQANTNKFYLKLDKCISSVEIPEQFVRRLQESIDKGISIDPLIKCWKRFLRNKKSTNALFKERFCEYIDLIYVKRNALQEGLDSGLSYELATALASTHEIKITQEGLLAAFKVSSEIEHKFTPDGDGNVKKVDRYTKTFDEVTGEITGDNRNDIAAEDRLYQPHYQGTSGDAFSCDGATGTNKLGHIIKIGCVHALPSWDMVNCDDDRSCVKGLHVGGLSYIAGWNGEIHECLIDPLHIGAICEYNGSLAMRVKEYYVNGSLTSLNHSIYHSSQYAKLTDAQWRDIADEIVANHGELAEEISLGLTEIKSL